MFIYVSYLLGVAIYDVILIISDFESMIQIWLCEVDFCLNLYSYLAITVSAVLTCGRASSPGASLGPSKSR